MKKYSDASQIFQTYASVSQASCEYSVWVYIVFSFSLIWMCLDVLSSFNYDWHCNFNRWGLCVYSDANDTLYHYIVHLLGIRCIILLLSGRMKASNRLLCFFLFLGSRRSSSMSVIWYTLGWCSKTGTSTAFRMPNILAPTDIDGTVEFISNKHL